MDANQTKTPFFLSVFQSVYFTAGGREAGIFGSFACFRKGGIPDGIPEAEGDFDTSAPLPWSDEDNVGKSLGFQIACCLLIFVSGEEDVVPVAESSIGAGYLGCSGSL